MTQTLIIAAREIRERSFVVAVAAFLATLPFLISAMPGSRDYGRLEMVGTIGAIAAINFAVALSMILGASIVGRELTERRLSFYFSRPINASAIWFGKVLGAWVLAAVSFAIIFIPSYLAGRKTWYRGFDATPGQVVGYSAAAVVIVFLVAHAISTITRSRSGFAAIDLIAIALAGGAVWMIVAPLVQAMAIELATVVAATLIVAAVVILLGAGAWQLSRGRADTRRNHVEMSKFLWIAAAITLAIVGAYTIWVFSADIDDLKNPEGTLSSRGDFSIVGGLSPLRGDFHSTFLLDMKSGKTVSLPVARWSGPEFSHAGDAVVTEAAPIGWRGKTTGEVVLYRFGRDERPERTGITERGGVVISDDLNRIAVLGATTVSIHEIDTQRLIASAPMPRRRGGARGFFVTPDVLRIFIIEKGSAPTEDVPLTLRIFELNAVTRQLAQTGSWSTTGAQLHVSVSADGNTILTNRFGKIEGPRLALLDGRTGTLRTSLPAGTGGFLGARLLADGRVAVISPEPKARALQIFTADGEHARDIPIGEASRARIINEVAGGKVIVGIDMTERWEGAGARGWETAVIDLNAGGVTRREREIVPALQWWGTDPRTDVPNQTGEILVADAAGQIWRWNTVTGEKKKLV
jgi:ABC-type transport system involved in multi-copper enzyme maturation permease subunit